MEGQLANAIDVQPAGEILRRGGVIDAVSFIVKLRTLDEKHDALITLKGSSKSVVRLLKKSSRNRIVWAIGPCGFKAFLKRGNHLFDRRQFCYLRLGCLEPPYAARGMPAISGILLPSLEFGIVG